MRKLPRETAELRRELDEAQDALRAIRKGEVDAVVVSGDDGDHVYVLKGAEQPYRVFIENMNEGAATLLRDGTVVYSNDRFARMLGWPLEQVMGAPLVSFVAPDCRDRLQPLLEQALNGRCSGVLPLLTHGETAIWAELSMCPVELEEDVGICVIASDITERKKTEELRAYLASIVDNTDDAIIGKDLDGTILSWNRGAERLYGYGAEEILGHSISTLCTPERPDEAIEILGRIGRGETVEHYEMERVRKDGRRVWVSLTVSPIRDSEGRIEGASAIARDMTERKRAEAALQESELAFRTLADGIPQMVWMSTPDGLSVYVNRRWVEYTGLTLGGGWNTTFHPDDRQPAWDAWNHAVETGEPYHVESRLRATDGSYRWFLMRGVPLRDTAGRIAKWFGTCTDIDDMKRTGEELRTLNEELDRRVAERTAELQTILDTAPCPIWIAHDPECRQITGNSYADEAVMQVPRGSNISAGAGPAQAAVQYKMFRKGRELKPEEMPAQVAGATGRTVTAEEEVDLVFPDGRTVSVMLSAAPLFDPEGNVRGVVATAADVTNLRKAEQALRDSEERLTLALRASEEGVWDWNLETGTLWYSERCTEMLGYRESDIEPTIDAWLSLLHPDDHTRFHERLGAFIHGKCAYEVEFRLRHKDGHYAPILSRGFPVRREAGGPIVRIVGTHLDLTERKRAEAERREGFYHRSLIEASLDPLVTIAPDGTIRDVNHATEQATGCAREELIGTDFCDYFADPQQAGMDTGRCFARATCMTMNWLSAIATGTSPPCSITLRCTAMRPARWPVFLRLPGTSRSGCRRRRLSSGGRPSWSGPTPSCSNSPTLPPTICRNRCARWRASRNCWLSAITTGSMPMPTTSSGLRWMAPAGHSG